MAKKSTVSKIVKRVDETKKNIQKPVEKKEVVVEETTENKNIKETVSKLIEHVDLLKVNVVSNSFKGEMPVTSTPENNFDVIVETKDSTLAWYEEQLSEMHQKYDEVVIEKQKLLELMDNRALGNSTYGVSRYDDDLKRCVIQLYLEIQDNHLNWGRNFIINPPNFLERLIELFPFLNNYRKY